MTSVQDRCNVARRRMMTRRRINNIVAAIESMEWGYIGVHMSRIGVGDDVLVGCMYTRDLVIPESRIVTCEIKVHGDQDLVVYDNGREQFTLDSDNNMKAAAQVASLLLSRLTGVF